MTREPEPSKRRSRRRFLALASAGLLGVREGAAQQAPAPETFTDPVTAGPDFLVQGEYISRRPGADAPNWALQVIAIGSGRFQGFFLAGGLPGAGWDGKTRIPVTGATQGELTEFEAAENGWKGRIAQEQFVGATGEGDRLLLHRAQRVSPTLGAKAPAGAVVLFDGASVDEWEPGAKTEAGLLLHGCRTRKLFRDFAMHLEFRVPFRPAARGQQRGNSGVYLLGEYELQILDSFGLTGAANECGALYRQKAPDVNMCLPPLAWQTFDLEFRAARIGANGEGTEPARITVRHNGVVIHQDVRLTGPTGGAARRPETAGPAAILLQNHRNPVHFRNIWVEEKA